MAKPNKTKDRRAVLEQLRREQRRTEKRRTYAIVAACVVVGLVIIGLGAYPLIKQSQVSAGDLETIGVPADQAGCQDVVTRPARGTNDHKQIGTQIDYQNSPPAFGPHYPVTAPMSRKFYSAGDRPELEYLVHNLEHGYNILWYDETVADDSDQLAQVKAIAGKFPGTDDLHHKFIAAPWTSEDGKPFPDGAHIALTHWSVSREGNGNAGAQKGIWLYCGKPSGAVVSQFVEDHPYTDSPEPLAM
ncbi:MAG TPA: DUF3105 domain-containing protein [Nocardioidaceae bacterium]|nr:DUF3105 domain-containing protein [Nocardioidaceae bacterium]